MFVSNIHCLFSFIFGLHQLRKNMSLQQLNAKILQCSPAPPSILPETTLWEWKDWTLPLTLKAQRPKLESYKCRSSVEQRAATESGDDSLWAWTMMKLYNKQFLELLLAKRGWIFTSFTASRMWVFLFVCFSLDSVVVKLMRLGFGLLDWQNNPSCIFIWILRNSDVFFIIVLLLLV